MKRNKSNSTVKKRCSKSIPEAKRLFNSGNYNEALAMIDSLMKIEPNEIDLLLLKAATLYRTQHLDEAEAICRLVAKNGQSNFEFDNILGLILKSTNREDEAKQHYEDAILRSPKAPDLYHNFANLLFTFKEISKASEIQRRALDIRPNHIPTLRLAGKIAVNNRESVWALEIFKQLLALGSDKAESLNGIGAAYLLANDHQNARDYFEQCLSVNPDTPSALSNLGILLKSNDELDKAEQCFIKAIQIEPDNVEHKWNLSLLKLMQGHFKEGWDLYESRYAESRTAPDRVPLPKLGAVTQLKPNDLVCGKVIAVIHEQGLGDTLQFTRLAEQLYNECATVLLIVPEELIEVMQTLPWAAYVSNNLKGFARVDHFVLTASLCKRYIRDESEIPIQIPYLFSNFDRQSHWNQLILREQKLNVALVWAGKPTHGNDMNRSLSLQDFKGLARLQDRCNFYAIQMGERANDPVPEGLTIVKLHESIKNFADTAAILQRMDLLITIDSSPAHLAGAMGVPVWVLVPKVSDFRWLKNRTDSPWYPTMKLYRQAEIGNWQPTLDNLVEDLYSLQARTNFSLSLDRNQSTDIPQKSGLSLQSENAVLRHQAGEDQRAHDLYRWVLNFDPQNVDVLRNLGVLYRKHSKYDLSEACYKKALAIAPNDKILLLNYANLKLHLDQFAEAKDLANKAAQIDTNISGIHYILAKCANHENDQKKALLHIRQACALSPGNKDFNIFLAYLLIKGDMLEEVAPMLPMLIEVGKAQHDANSLLGQYYSKIGDHQRAIDFYSQSLRLNPNNKLDYVSRGNEYAAALNMSAALDDFKSAVANDPSYTEGHLNLALSYLMMGDFERGLPEYEWRLDQNRTDGQNIVFPTFGGAPRWEGQSLQGKIILLYPEQGFGDAIQYVRYAKELKEQGATVYCACKAPLERLFKTCPWIDKVLVDGSVLPTIDFWVPMLSLPYLCKTTLGTIPACIPYFNISADASKENLNKIGCKHLLGKKNLVLVWSGSKTHKNDSKRSISKEYFRPLLDLAGYNVIAFDFESKDPMVVIDDKQIENFANYSKDFYDLASLLRHSSCLVSVDSSPVHLAGSINVKTNALIACLPDFRWMLNRDDSPWYHSITLFRQKIPGDWSNVIAKLCNSLKQKNS